MRFSPFAVKNNAKPNRKERKVLFLQKMNNKYYSKEEALQKAKQYCAYQERSHSEVKEKLYSFGLYKKEVDELLSELISDNYLNEERFAIQFAGGKFRIKQWGRVKIKYALKQKQVSEYCIKKALTGIDENDYNRALEKLFDQKLKILKTEKNIFIKKRKLHNHLMQKGFETDLISKLVAEMR
ncbi:MAG: regulatory protein RecX [Ferruginibacter sp.]